MDTTGKELKSYIHLYIGCKVQWIRSDGHLVIQDLTLSDASWLRERKDAKIILRPLESMTEHEKNECYNAGDEAWYPVKFGKIMEQSAEIKYLLSKGFDIFGLKEAGLAVYETENV